MTINEVKKHLESSKTIAFELPNGKLVPSHFHVTEVGKVSKDFIDCGGTRRQETVANFQLWEENDYDHRLHPEKLVHIINLSQKLLGIGDLNIEVEYQGETIGKYDLDHNGTHFLLTAKQTNCLAKEACAIPSNQSSDGSSIANPNSCDPNMGCC